jgi:hypothetical protein
MGKWETQNGNKLKLQLILPEQKRIEVMTFFHDMPTAGHLGVEKTLEKVKESFYWPGMKDYIQDYCRQCDRCFAIHSNIADSVLLNLSTHPFDCGLKLVVLVLSIPK